MQMNYFVFGSNNLAASRAFYQRLFEGSDWQLLQGEGRMTVWSNGGSMFAIAEPHDGEAASNGNGTMLGLNLGSAQDVDRLHRLALQLGGEDEGAPGIRSGRYAAYVRDLDGNKLCLFE